MNDRLIRWLESLPEEETYPLLRDLLISMGYKRVTISHGILEAGRDICFMETDRLGRNIWRGVQVKTTPLSGSLSSDKGIRTLVNQCEAAMDTPFTTPNGEDVFISEMWFVSTHLISDNAKLSIKGKLRGNNRLHIIDGPTLCDLIEEHLPHLVEAGSKPIEAYLRHLIEFCESPAEYLSIRLKSKWLISDMFIDPIVTIQVIDPSYLSKKDILPSLKGFLQRIDYYKSLLTHRLLPLAELYTLLEQTSSLVKLHHSISRVNWFSSKTEEFGSALRSFISDIAGCEANIEPSFPTDDFIEQLDPSLNISRLLALEGQILKIDDEATEILKRYANLKARAERLGSVFSSADKGLMDIYQEEARAEISRQQFFDNLLAAYKKSANASEPMARLALKVSMLFYEQLDHRDRFALDQKAAVIQEFLQRFDAELKEIYGLLWNKNFRSDFENHEINPENQDLMSAIGELNQLTSFVKEFYGLNNDETIELTCNGLALCHSLPKIVFAGDLGMGKTTLLKQFGQILAKKAIEDLGYPIPIFAILSTIDDVIEQPMEEAFQRNDNGVSLKFEIDGHKKIQWVLDGLDEVASLGLRERILDWCSDSTIPRKIILSSRPHGLPYYIPGFTLATIGPISKEMVELLVLKFPWGDIKRAEKLVSVLKNSSALMSLARNPLLLMLIIVMATYRDPEVLPKRREDIYDNIVKLLLGEWDKAKAVIRSNVIEDESFRRRVLQKVAFLLYSNKRRPFKKEEFISAVMAAIPCSPPDFETSRKFFDDLLRDCMLIPLSPETYGFCHFSIQEYLAAEELGFDVDLIRVWHVIEEYYRSEGWWEEVLVFYAGIKRDVSFLINNLHRHLSTKESRDPNNKGLLNLLRRWVDVADFMDSDNLKPQGTVATAFTNLRKDKEI